MKIRNVTPESHRCAGGACPAFFKTDRDSFLIVGKMVSSPPEELEGKVGPEEAVVEIPAGLLRDLFQSQRKGWKERDRGHQGEQKYPEEGGDQDG